MKSIFRNQKSSAWLILVGVLSVMAACKQTEPEPPLADQLVGDYTVNSYTSGANGVTLPANTTTGITVTARIVASRISEDVASFVFVFTQTKSGIASSSTSKLNDVPLKKGSSGAIEGSVGVDGISWQNNQLTLTFGDPDPSKVLTIYAKKD